MVCSADRVAGSDRYGTGVAAASRVTPGVMPGLGRTAIVASGEVFADALVAGPIAARGIHPVLLSPPDELHTDVAEYLSSAGIERVVVMGGTAALSAAVETAITDLGVSVRRLAGKTRYDTAVKAAELVTDRYSTAAGQTCFATGTIGVARARVPFDSFSAAPLLGRLCAPLVLADPKQIPADTAAFLDTARDANTAVDLRVFGGNAAVSQTAIDAYLAGEDDEAAEATQPDDDAAELVGLSAGTCGGSIDDEVRQLTTADNSEDPAWSPDCSRIAFSSNGWLWAMNNDGTNQQRLTAYDGSYSDEPAWSPDGTEIAYSRGQRNDDGHWFSHIYVANADGSGRSKVSKGDVRDGRPSWSPDGTRLVFQRLSGTGRDDDGNFVEADRYLVVMDATGQNPVTLAAGGSGDQSPVWSPDGARLAYISNDSVWLIDADGSDPERIIAGAFWNGGVSWSPDGRRVAFARGDAGESAIVIAGIDGAAEAVIADVPGPDIGPRWSPDGMLIAFTNYATDSERNIYVAGARGMAAAVADCMPRGLKGVTAGFPLPNWTAPSTGTLRVAVLFMDFPDAQATHSTQQEAELGLPFMEAYLEAVSYGRLDVEVVPYHRWLRVARSSDELRGMTVLGLSLAEEAGRQAVALADPDVDFSDVHAVMTIFPSTHFSGGNAGGEVTVDGHTLQHSRVNAKRVDEVRLSRDERSWGSSAAHELVHSLGLLDLYSYDDSVHEQPAARTGHEWVGVKWGRMNLWAWYLAPEDDQRRRLLWRFPNGGTTTSSHTHLYPEEMLAWSRWQLGWLDESQVRCLSDTDTIVTLSPIAEPKSGIAMAAVQINAREVIVIESRRKLGYDLGRDYTAPNGGRTTIPNLIEEGVLVYTVDTLVSTGQLPMRIAGDEGNGQVDDFPVLGVGESVTVAGYTITVTADDGNTHTVTMTSSG